MLRIRHLKAIKARTCSVVFSCSREQKIGTHTEDKAHCSSTTSAQKQVLPSFGNLFVASQEPLVAHRLIARHSRKNACMAAEERWNETQWTCWLTSDLSHVEVHKQKQHKRRKDTNLPRKLYIDPWSLCTMVPKALYLLKMSHGCSDGTYWISLRDVD